MAEPYTNQEYNIVRFELCDGSKEDIAECKGCSQPTLKHMEEETYYPTCRRCAKDRCDHPPRHNTILIITCARFIDIEEKKRAIEQEILKKRYRKYKRILEEYKRSEICVLMKMKHICGYTKAKKYELIDYIKKKIDDDDIYKLDKELGHTDMEEYYTSETINRRGYISMETQRNKSLESYDSDYESESSSSSDSE